MVNRDLEPRAGLKVCREEEKILTEPVIGGIRRQLHPLEDVIRVRRRDHLNHLSKDAEGRVERFREGRATDRRYRRLFCVVPDGNTAARPACDTPFTALVTAACFFYEKPVDAAEDLQDDLETKRHGLCACLVSLQVL